ncbi:hypothetical protein PPYR_00522 [Photinus pyralis]|uniref:Lipocalin/cytosolic fatty-acid binding domain-containing protein n=1 Tax=Photinus pyralis TaxID=7054 RepID=A0A5N4B1S5_PHOPY|nr:apolipoprotein D-like [Photinus pyralis]KAB0803552.1 hypothetical protein PPYR_00522 [Photinus pyralis]
MVSKTILLALCLLPVVFSQTNTTFTGTCPTVLIQAKFNETKFAGKWYEIKRFNNTFITGHCGRPSYKWNKTNYTVTYPTKNLQTGTVVTTNFTLKKQLLQNPGKYDVYANKVKNFIPQYILSTDYNTYSVVWGCSYKNNQNIQHLFVYSRNGTLSANFFNKTIKPILVQNKLNVTRLVDIVQDPKKCGGL